MDSWDKLSFEDLAIDVLEHIASVGAIDMHSMGDLSSVIPDGLLEKSLELVDKGCVVVLEAEPSGRDVIVVRRSRGSSFRSESGSGEIKDDRKAYCVWENMCTCPDFLSNPGFAAGKPAVMCKHRLAASIALATGQFQCRSVHDAHLCDALLDALPVRIREARSMEPSRLFFGPGMAVSDDASAAAGSGPARPSEHHSEGAGEASARSAGQAPA